eukprot:14449054-Alexandrium_andersonii.AAC.1
MELKRARGEQAYWRGKAAKLSESLRASQAALQEERAAHALVKPRKTKLSSRGTPHVCSKTTVLGQYRISYARNCGHA